VRYLSAAAMSDQISSARARIPACRIAEDFADHFLRSCGKCTCPAVKRGGLGICPPLSSRSSRRAAGGGCRDRWRVAVVALDEGVVAEIAVLAKDRFAQEINEARPAEDMNDGTRAERRWPSDLLILAAVHQ